MKRMINAAKKLKVKKLNKEPGPMGDQYGVGEKTVRIFKKPGRTLITCSCEHGTRYCNSPTICKHKLVVIKFIMDENYKFKFKNSKILRTWIPKEMKEIRRILK